MKRKRDDDFMESVGVTEIRWVAGAAPEGSILIPRVVVSGQLRSFGTEHTVVDDSDRFARSSDLVYRLNDGTRVLITAKVIR